MVTHVAVTDGFTYFCFIRLMLGCMGGGCADKVSPFLEFAILYAFSSAALISSMHWGRAISQGQSDEPK